MYCDTRPRNNITIWRQLANGRSAFISKLLCHSLRGLQERQIAVIKKVPDTKQVICKRARGLEQIDTGDWLICISIV